MINGYELDEQGFIRQRRLPDQRLLAVDPMGIGARLGIGPKPPLEDSPTFDNAWHFLSIESALDALSTWNPDEETEPTGWHRHPDTGRYRISGDPSLEYVKGDGREVTEQVAYAIRVIGGVDRVIVEINDHTSHLGASFPESTRLYSVRCERSTCQHQPKCWWLYKIFHYLDRSVVLRLEDMATISVKNVLRRLTER